MPEFQYARGRIGDSLRFISEEMKEFEEEYAIRTWNDYQDSKKVQKLMDRTVENILTALIEVCGTLLTEEGIGSRVTVMPCERQPRFLGFQLKNKKAWQGLPFKEIVWLIGISTFAGRRLRLSRIRRILLSH